MAVKKRCAYCNTRTEDWESVNGGPVRCWPCSKKINEADEAVRKQQAVWLGNIHKKLGMFKESARITSNMNKKEGGIILYSLDDAKLFMLRAPDLGMKVTGVEVRMSFHITGETKDKA